MSFFYVVATPIGNLEDITYRAVRILGEVQVVAAEDTRHTRKLLGHYDIRPDMLISCRSHNEQNSAAGIVQLLDKGKDVAYVSDAGTPGISDPGGKLVSIVRQTHHSVVPIPGASALTALLSVAGIPGKGFIFEGFLSPKKSRRQKRLRELLGMGLLFVLYESPHRLTALLEDLNELSPEREIFLGKEITKKFERFFHGNPENILRTFAEGSIIKGEITVIVGKC